MRLLLVAALMLPDAGALAEEKKDPAPRPAEAEAEPAPMDLVSGDSRDANGIALNPQWGLQVLQPGSVPDAAQTCFSVPGWFDNPLCSTQHPAFDRPAGLRRLICSIGAETPVAGHVNWYAATYEGPVFWDSFSFFDRDYNVRLVPPTRNGLTVHNPDNHKGEFDARETTEQFVTPWWTRFRRALAPGKRTMIDGKAAIISGLVGLDCEHGCPSELHPVWVLAIHAQNDPRDDVWAVFARNWGNEGFCSDLQHEVSWPRERFTLTLPWRAGATGVELDPRTRFVGNTGGISGGWRAVPGEKVNLTFVLPPPAARAIVHGELHLRWQGGAGRAEVFSPVSPPEETAWEPQGGEAEALLEDLVRQLPPERRDVVERRLGALPARMEPVAVPLRPATAEAEEEGAAARASVASKPDPARAAEEERRLRILLRAFDGDIPGPIGQALQRKPPPRQR